MMAPKMTPRVVLLAAVVAPMLALGAVGKVAVLEGSGTRTPKGGKAVALAVGTDLELNDTVKMAKGNAKLVLTDESVLMLGDNSELVINEAEFAGLERKGFSAKLLFGKVWAKVKKAAAGSDAKFEVTTERAVAGVRGTVFRIDATKLLKAATGTGGKPKKQDPDVVRVEEGVVAVEASFKKVAQATTSPAGGKTGERRQVAGPTEISKEEWEKKFVELQKNMQVTIGETPESWTVGELQKPNDSLAKFVAANDTAAEE